MKNHPSPTIQKIRNYTGHSQGIYTLAEGPEGNILYSADGSGLIAEWDLNDPDQGKQLARVDKSIYALHYFAVFHSLVIGKNFEGIYKIDVREKTLIHSLRLTKTQIFDIKHHDDKLFVATGNGSLYIVSFEKFTVLKEIKLSDKSIRSIDICKKENEIALGLSDNTIRILDLENYQQKYRIDAHKLSVFSVVYAPRGKVLISGGRDAQIKVWDINNDYILKESIAAHMYAVNSISFRKDGKLFASGSMDKTVKIWSSDDFRLLKVIDSSRHNGHTSSVNKVLWSGFNDYLISGSDDNTISVWDLQFIY